MRKKEKKPQLILISAFDDSKTKSVSETCRIAGLSRVTFYHYFNNDAVFRSQIVERQKAHLSGKITAQEVV